MIKRILRNGSNLLTRRQTSILSAATVIMVMIAASRLLGLIRNRVLAHFYSAESLAVYFAAFRLPEVVFEILVFGSLASAFIPTFTTYLARKGKQEAWHVAAVSLNIALLVFFLFAVIIFFLGKPLYQLMAPGFSPQQINETVRLARWLIFAQGFFVFSYFLTGVLESLQRFLLPALAPLFYNLGIIFGTFFLAKNYGIAGATIGAVVGAGLHLLVQLPLVFSLGFRPKLSLDFSHPGVREIGALAWPRMVELSVLQLGKSAELFLASLIFPAAYTYLNFANSLQLLPVGLFGTSISKASLPALARLAAQKQKQAFRENLAASFNQITFLVLPCSVFLAILRIPLVRLAFGAAQFTWESTVQTGYVLSAFSLGILAQTLAYLLTRAFYALRETKTPVKVSILSIFANIVLAAIFVLGFSGPVWSLALAFSLASIVQCLLLLFLITKRLPGFFGSRIIKPFTKILISSFVSGGLMFFLLKIFDRSVWDKRLSFLGRFGLVLPTSFDRFVFDTRFTLNVMVLTGLVGLVGFLSYLFLAWLLKLEELRVMVALLKRLKKIKKPPASARVVVGAESNQSG